MVLKILLDECLPRKLKRELTDYDVKTVQEAGWASKRNGELLRLMTGVFDVFITVDGNMSYQQNFEGLPIRFIILVAYNNRIESLLPLMPRVREALLTIQAGQTVMITIENQSPE